MSKPANLPARYLEFHFTLGCRVGLPPISKIRNWCGFSLTSDEVNYPKKMHVLCLSKEPDFFRQVATAFSERILQVECRSTAEEFLAAAANRTWDVFVIDLDEVPYATPLDFSRNLGPRASVLNIGSSRWNERREEIELARQKLMLKPTTVGEVGLALHKLFAEQKRNKPV